MPEKPGPDDQLDNFSKGRGKETQWLIQGESIIDEII